MRKFKLILGALSGLFLLSLVSLHNRAGALDRELVAKRMECKQRINRLRSDFQAEIEDLQEYLRKQYNFTPAAANAPLAGDPDGQQQSSAADGDPDLAQTTERKYSYMYADLPDMRDSVLEMLRQLLLERERLIAAGDASAEEIAAIEAQIGELLGAGGYQEYQILKDSDPEQHHLREYAASVSEHAPITPEQERSILFVKLRHKQIFHNTLRGAGFYQQHLSPQAAAQLRNVISKGLAAYRNNYLAEVKPLLSSEQFKMLDKYETTEFNWERERLFKQLSAKTASPSS